MRTSGFRRVLLPLLGTSPWWMAVPASAQPLAIDTSLTVTSSLGFSGAQSARFNPSRPNLTWVGRRSSNADGLYRVALSGRAERVATGSNVAALMIGSTPDIVFFSEDYGGTIVRVDTSSDPAVSATWVSGLHTGDDDPVGMALVPGSFSGAFLRPGQAVVVDRGASGLDEVWVWSATVAQTQAVLLADPQNPMVDAVDVAISNQALYFADTGDAAAGHIWRMDAPGSLTELVTQSSFPSPVGIEVDPLTGDLLVLDSALGALFAVHESDGSVRELVRGFTIPGDEWASIDALPDGTAILVTAGDAVWTVSRCATGLTEENDCNQNGTLDRCELAAGSARDCNANGRLDECDLGQGLSADCDGDGIPDECPQCPNVEVTVVFDTSSSMNDEASALCSEVTAIEAELRARDITINTEILGISDTPGGGFACLEGTVIQRYGRELPGDPPSGNDVLGTCPGGNEVASEDWGRATTVVVGKKVWDSHAVKLVVPIADEGPWCGDPVTEADVESIRYAIATATTARVLVSPVTGSGSSQGVRNLAATLAESTGGLHLVTSAGSDIPEAILEVVSSACFASVDCNGNAVIDTCDLATGHSRDCDRDGVPDECEVPRPECPEVDAGTGDDAASALDGASSMDAEAPGDGDVLQGEDADVAADRAETEAGAMVDALPSPSDAGSGDGPTANTEDGGGCSCRAVGSQGVRGQGFDRFDKIRGAPAHGGDPKSGAPHDGLPALFASLLALFVLVRRPLGTREMDRRTD